MASVKPVLMHQTLILTAVLGTRQAFWKDPGTFAGGAKVVSDRRCVGERDCSSGENSGLPPASPSRWAAKGKGWLKTLKSIFTDVLGL